MSKLKLSKYTCKFESRPLINPRPPTVRAPKPKQAAMLIQAALEAYPELSKSHEWSKTMDIIG